jgi:hypothetical protein
MKHVVQTARITENVAHWVKLKWSHFLGVAHPGGAQNETVDAG